MQDTAPPRTCVLFDVDPPVRRPAPGPRRRGAVRGDWPHSWLRRVVVALGALAHAPAEVWLRTLDTLPAEECGLVVAQDSPVMGEPVQTVCLHVMIEDQMDRPPDAVDVRVSDRCQSAEPT